MANSMVELKDYFEVDAREFRAFWDSLTEAEKAYYKSADLKK